MQNKRAFYAQASAALRFAVRERAHNERMRLLPLLLTSILVGGCSAGAGMQATPPAPIAQSGDSTASASPLRTSSDAPAEDVTGDVTEGALQPPVSQSVSDASVATGAGGRFLLI